MKFHISGRRWLKGSQSDQLKNSSFRKKKMNGFLFKKKAIRQDKQDCQDKAASGRRTSRRRRKKIPKILSILSLKKHKIESIPM
jgi:hypothetical protein